MQCLKRFPKWSAAPTMTPREYNKITSKTVPKAGKALPAVIIKGSTSYCLRVSNEGCSTYNDIQIIQQQNVSTKRVPISGKAGLTIIIKDNKTLQCLKGSPNRTAVPTPPPREYNRKMSVPKGYPMQGKHDLQLLQKKAKGGQYNPVVTKRGST